MEPFLKKATEDTPEIKLDAQKGIFSISKSSLPENAVEFYRPVISWINKYAKSPNPESVFNFNIEYLNTASSKQVFEIIMAINKINKKGDVKIKWHYDAIDEDMLGLGTRFSNLVNIDIEFIEYDTEEDIDFQI
ncbi:MAG: DUF1987 domain-containing protein [Bacteroidota bacterium]|nr:DUF1987 domain-containing protein [Bacteroidota bacterium]